MRQRRAYTLLELLFVSLMLLLVFSMAYTLLRPRLPEERPFLDQRALLAFATLQKRLGESIQILAPARGRTAATIEFVDIHDKTVRLQQVPEKHEWASFQGDQPEDGPEAIRLTDCQRASFTALSPSLVMAVLTVGKKEDSRTFMASIRLRNVAMAR
ncbi:MAG: hypothetical protein HY303_13120 [Candidatus Wallbacteria bacterium]|nr:hypothetical protein [Candidatus Wallbacteria bacterium]